MDLVVQTSMQGWKFVTMSWGNNEWSFTNCIADSMLVMEMSIMNFVFAIVDLFWGHQKRSWIQGDLNKKYIVIN